MSDATFTSSENQLDSLELFHKSYRKSDIVSSRIEHIYPANTLTGEGPFTFVILTDQREWIQPSATRLYGEISLEDETKAALSAESTSDSLSNNTINSLFKHVQVEINGKTVSDQSTTAYPYKSYIEIINSYSAPSLKSHLATQSFHTHAVEDVRGDLKSTPAKLNIKKFARTKIDFSLVLQEDFFQIQQLFPGGTKITVTLLRSNNEFLFLQKKPATGTTGKKFTVNFKKLYLTVTKYQLSPAKQIYLDNKLKQTKAIYPFTRGIIKKFLLDKGSQSLLISRICVGTLPRGLIIGFVKSAAFDGDKQEDPFNFQDFSLASIQLICNGTPIPANPLSINIGEKHFQEAYRHYLDNIGISNHNLSTLITQSEFTKGGLFFPFNLTPDQCQGGTHLHPAIEGTINVSLTYHKEITESIAMITYQLFDNHLYIDEKKVITCDYE